MIPPIKQKKDTLRSQYKEIRKALPKEEKEARDLAVCNIAKNLASFRFSEYVLLYAALPDEISLTCLAAEALRRGKKILYPRCCKEERTMTYHFVSSPDELYPDSYGICEPSPDSPALDIKKLSGNAVCFVPGLLFDREGYRLGYGGGYYDRFLSEFRGNRIGVIYSDFIIDEVPRGRYDLQMDALLTENNVINVNKGLK